LGKLGLGAVEKVIPGKQKEEEVFDRFVDFLKQRYGSWERFQETFRTDPVGTALDLSIVFGGSGALMRRIGQINKVPELVRAGEIISKTGRTIEPLGATGKGVKRIVRPITKATGEAMAWSLGVSTGQGGEAIKTAFRMPGKAFTQALRGKTTGRNILTVAREGLQRLKDKRAMEYQREAERILKRPIIEVPKKEIKPAVKIPKELEPLAKEARKYKSAEEFEKAFYPKHALDISKPELHNFGRLKNIADDPEFHLDLIQFKKEYDVPTAGLNEWQVIWKGYRGELNYPEPDLTKPITVYRALPKGKEIGPGDWVALTKEYAEKHLKPGSVIKKKKVSPKDVRWAGTDPQEWIYAPRKMVELMKKIEPKDFYSQAIKETKEIKTTAKKPVKSLDISPIFKTLKEELEKFNIKVKGKELDFSRSPIDKTEVPRVKAVIEIVRDWGLRKGDRTPYALDILKRKLDDFYTPSREGATLIGNIRKTVKKILDENVPGYKEMTKKYAETSELIKEIEKTLSLQPGSTADTALRKLTNALKADNELRQALLDEIDKLTPFGIREAIAGHLLHPVVPTGLIGRSIWAAAGGAGLARAASIISALIDPLLVSGIVFTSPRIVGEFVRALGLSHQAAQKVIDYIASKGGFIRAGEAGLYQAGRLKEE